MPHYIRGIFDGDGSISIYQSTSTQYTKTYGNKKYTYTKFTIRISGNKELLKGIKNYLTYGTIRPDKSIFSLDISGKQML